LEHSTNVILSRVDISKYKLLEVVPGIEAKDLQLLIEKQIKKASTICPDGWRAYIGLAAKDYVLLSEFQFQ